MQKKNNAIPERVVSFSEGIDDQVIAEAFAKLQILPQFKILRNIPIQVLFRSNPSMNSKVMDFGCGTGHFLLDLHKKTHRKGYKFKLFGLDVAQSMLDQCEKTLKRKKITDVKLIIGDGKTIPVQDEFFDSIVTNLSLHHWEEPIQVLSEIYRVLRPEGYFIIFDMRRSAPRFWFKFLNFVTKRIAPKALRIAGEPLGSLLASYTEDEIVHFIKNSPWQHTMYTLKSRGLCILCVFKKEKKK